VSSPSNAELKEHERTSRVAAANGWKRRDELHRQGAAPVMTLVRQLDDETRESFIADVIDSADALKQGDTLCVHGTAWQAAASK